MRTGFRRLGRGAPVWALVLTALALAGCSHRLADLSVVSTRNVSLDAVDLDSLPQTKNAVGQSSVWILFFVPLGLPHLEDAVDDALNRRGGDVMVDVVVYEKWWWFLLGQQWIEVRGNVVRTRGPGAA